jgi:hypothetical protein
VDKQGVLLILIPSDWMFFFLMIPVATTLYVSVLFQGRPAHQLQASDWGYPSLQQSLFLLGEGCHVANPGRHSQDCVVPLALLAGSEHSQTTEVLEGGERRREGRAAGDRGLLVAVPLNMLKVANLSLRLGSRAQSLLSGDLTPQIPHPCGQLSCPKGTGPRRAWLLAAKWLGGKF